MKNIDEPTTHDFLRLGLFVVQNLELLALQSIGVSKAEGNIEGNTENTTAGKTVNDGKTPRPRVYQSLLNLHRVILEIYAGKEGLQACEEGLQACEERDIFEKERYQNFLFSLIRIIKAAIDGYIFSHKETIVRCKEELEKACATLTLEKNSRYATLVSSLSEAALLFCTP